MLGLVPIANGYTNMTSFNAGFSAGHKDGTVAVAGIDDSCDGYTYTQCQAGYYMGWNTSCHQGIAKFGNADAMNSPTSVSINLTNLNNTFDPIHPHPQIIPCITLHNNGGNCNPCLPLDGAQSQCPCAEFEGNDCYN
jgi:hypothetical protein